MKKQKLLKQNNKKGWEMYFSLEAATAMAELEQNDKNFRVAKIVDMLLMRFSEDMPNPLYVAELGGGAHPDRYHEFFDRLLAEPRGRIDWVDVSPHMLKLADKYLSNDKYQARKEVINYVESEILDYLRAVDEGIFDLLVMKYTLDHIENLEALFELLSRKMKYGARLIATISIDNSELKSYSTNACYSYNGEDIPTGETRTLSDGDNFSIKFFKISGDPDSGYLAGAEVTKYYHSTGKIKKLAKLYGFEVFIGDWKQLLARKQQQEGLMDQSFLVLTKK